MDRKQSLEMAVKCTKYARSITKDDPAQAGTDWQFEFSPLRSMLKMMRRKQGLVAR
jgi:hypothetical protein